MSAPLADGAPALRLDRIHAGYGDRTVLEGLSLTVAAGEAYALIGPNGAGKSTAARVACGLLAPRSGAATVAGRGRGRIGLAPQESALFDRLTIRENLDAMARLGGLRRAARPAAVDRALDRAGCAGRADERVSALSGGWRRRASLAAALVCGPGLLVLDEPTEGVDAATRTALALAVKTALAEGAGCLMISHDAAFVAAVATRVGVLSRGRLVAEGAPSDLLFQAFGAALRLTVRFPVRPPPGLESQMQDQGLEREADTVTWRRVGDDVDRVSAVLAAPVQAAGGEVSIRRPDLDDLLTRLTGPAR